MVENIGFFDLGFYICFCDYIKVFIITFSPK